jgi:phage terminase large subunit
MLDGVWCEQAGAVYNEFSEDIHIIRGKLPDGFVYWQRIRSVDFGYINPFVCLWGAIDGDGRLYIYKEYYKRQQTVQVHSQYIKNYEPKENYRWTVADHDSEDRATLAINGIPTLSAKKDVETGIKAVKERLKKQGDGKPRLFIHESCVDTISEFYDYNWDTPKEGKNYKEEPVKDRDHAMDALRYMVMQLDGLNKGNYESFVFKNDNDKFNIM